MLLDHGNLTAREATAVRDSAIEMADPLAPNAGDEEEEEIAELMKGVRIHGGELSLAYRPFKYIPGVRTSPQPPYLSSLL